MLLFLVIVLLNEVDGCLGKLAFAFPFKLKQNSCYLIYFKFGLLMGYFCKIMVIRFFNEFGIFTPSGNE